jgi:hypothetical protein
MSQVKARIPKDKQCFLFKQYLSMNEEFPIILFDELNAFVNGCFVAKEYGDERQFKEEFTNAHKLHYFCGVLLDVVPKSYQDLDRLKEFHRMQKLRLDNIMD